MNQYINIFGRSKNLTLRRTSKVLGLPLDTHAALKTSRRSNGCTVSSTAWHRTPLRHNGAATCQRSCRLTLARLTQIQFVLPVLVACNLLLLSSLLNRFGAMMSNSQGLLHAMALLHKASPCLLIADLRLAVIQLPTHALRLQFISSSELHLGLAASSRGQSYG